MNKQFNTLINAWAKFFNSNKTFADKVLFHYDTERLSFEFKLPNDYVSIYILTDRDYKPLFIHFASGDVSVIYYLKEKSLIYIGGETEKNNEKTFEATIYKFKNLLKYHKNKPKIKNAMNLYYLEEAKNWTLEDKEQRERGIKKVLKNPNNLFFQGSFIDKIIYYAKNIIK